MPEHEPVCERALSHANWHELATVTIPKVTDVGHNLKLTRQDGYGPFSALQFAGTAGLTECVEVAEAKRLGRGEPQ